MHLLVSRSLFEGKGATKSKFQSLLYWTAHQVLRRPNRRILFLVVRMAHNADDILPTPKPSSMFSFTTTVASSVPVSLPEEVAPAPELRIFSPTKEILPLYLLYLERFQFAEAARVLSLASVRPQFLPYLPPFSVVCDTICFQTILTTLFSLTKYQHSLRAR